MARTRNIGAFIDPNEAGELLDKDGKPIPTVAHQTWTGVSQQANPDVAPEATEHHEAEPEIPAEIVPTSYLCDRTTWQRDLDGYEAMKLLDLILGGLTVTIDADVFSQLSADTRRHFRRV